MSKEYRIDPELKSIMSELAKDEKDTLEKSLLQDGYKGPPIVVWEDTIIDGHNRYELCRKHNIPFEVQEMQFDSKEEVIQWMIRAQIGRRNLNHAQRIRLAERFRPLFEQQARKNQGTRNDLLNIPQNLVESDSSKNIPPNLGDSKKKRESKSREVNSQLAKIANVSPETYRKGVKVLNSDDNEDLRQDMLSGNKSINASYKELQRLEKEGHKMDIPQQVKESASDLVVEKQIEGKKEHISVEEYLLHIKASGDKLLTDVSDGVNWLLQKEYISASGSDITSRIRTELNDYLDGLRKFQDLIATMCPDECGNENVIQIKSM